MDILILGQKGATNIGESFYRAAQAKGLKVEMLDSSQAYEGNLLLKRIFWHLLDRMPIRISSFEKYLQEICQKERPRIILTTGLAPIRKKALEVIKKILPQTKFINYLTDDPWNPVHRCRWFMDALPAYDFIFNPRKANIEQLKNLGCRNVEFLPFGYDEALFFPEKSDPAYQSSILFVGCADQARIAYIEEIAREFPDFALYGDYWEKNPSTRASSRGYANITTMRKAIASAQVVLCLVRQANRDGNSMRSFEVPALGACMLMENTKEHHDIFGPEGESVVYFSNKQEMVSQIRKLLANKDLCLRLKEKSHQLIIQGKHTYSDRLDFMLGRLK